MSSVFLKLPPFSKKAMTKMSAVARAVQSVRPHIPMIKFPDRAAPAKSSLEAMTASPFFPSVQPAAVTAAPTPNGPVYTKPVGYTPRGSGGEWHTLPSKYQRKPISQEEMEYIERGGPE